MGHGSSFSISILFVLSDLVIFFFNKVFAQLLRGITFGLDTSFVQGMLLCLVLGVSPGTTQGTLYCWGFDLGLIYARAFCFYFLDHTK